MRARRLVLVAVLALAPAQALAASNDTRLVDAAKRRDLSEIARLLKQKADVNATTPDSATALHWAAHWDDVAAADLLIAAGARVDVSNDYGVQPLMLAATNGSAAMIERLLKAGANPRSALPTGETALMTAARTGRTDAVSALIAGGADVNARQASKGQTALMWAVSERHAPVVQLLLDHHADVNAATNGGFTALMFAAREGAIEMGALLLAAGADIDASAKEDGSTAILVATVRGHAQFARFLLEKGARPDGNLKEAGYTALHWASGKFEGVTSHDYPNAPGEWAALGGVPNRNEKLELIGALLSHGADINARVTKDLPRYGFSLSAARAQFGATPFYLAAQVADVDVMRILIATGADITLTTNDHTTALIVAAGYTQSKADAESLVPESEFVRATRMLLDLGAGIHAANDQGFSAIHGAVIAGYTSVVQLLVDSGARLNDKTKAGQTPLGIAEGYFGGFYFERPAAAALLRRLGAISEGRVTLEGTIANPDIGKRRDRPRDPNDERSSQSTPASRAPRQPDAK